ncbi:hypothetical protein OIU74_025012 [Salix koriyanagi]|uniref:Uncharacterized protein n=1 Tax=Salix koriyanagi TaxID=2511006 RepID=A0A9Q0W838_9ROSI|nr:hypothetical protein OIU74_025012 [Salix koriyanagi]
MQPRYGRPDFRLAKTRLCPPSPRRLKSCWACWGMWPDVLLLSMTHFPNWRDPLGPAKIRLRPLSPGRLKSYWACWGTWPDVLLLSMTRFPAGGDPYLAGEDPILATAFGPPTRLAGALGLLLRGEGVAFICRARVEVWQPQRALHRGWHLGRSGSCLSSQAGGPAEVERHRRGLRLDCSQRGRCIKLPGLCPCVGPPRDP